MLNGMSDGELIQAVLDDGALDDKARDAFIDMAAKLEEGSRQSLTQKQRAWAQIEFDKLEKRPAVDYPLRATRRGQDVEIKCGPLPLHPPGRPGNARRTL